MNKQTKKKVKAKVVNGDWEITKYKMRQNMNNTAKVLKSGSKYVLIGVGMSIGLISKYGLRKML